VSRASARTIRIFSPEVSTDSVIHESPAWAPRCSHPERRGRRLTQRPPPFRIDPTQNLMQSHEEGSAAGWVWVASGWPRQASAGWARPLLAMMGCCCLGLVAAGWAMLLLARLGYC